jgi:hypothetical protein
MTRKEKRKVLRMVQKHLNDLYDRSADICRSFDRESLPLSTFKNIVKLACFQNPPAEFAEFAINFNKAMGSLYTAAEEFAKANHETRVPLTKIRELCNEFIAAFKEGQAEQ